MFDKICFLGTCYSRPSDENYRLGGESLADCEKKTGLGFGSFAIKGRVQYDEDTDSYSMSVDPSPKQPGRYLLNVQWRVDPETHAFTNKTWKVYKESTEWIIADNSGSNGSIWTGIAGGTLVLGGTVLTATGIFSEAGVPMAIGGSALIASACGESEKEPTPYMILSEVDSGTLPDDVIKGDMDASAPTVDNIDTCDVLSLEDILELDQQTIDVALETNTETDSNISPDTTSIWFKGSCTIDEYDEIEFADPNLKACVSAHLGGVESVTPHDCDILSLNCSGKNISSLSGIECCTSLNSVKLDSNNLTDISPLYGMSELVNLWLDNNFIENIEPLNGHHKLNKLGLSHNNISALPLSIDLSSLQSLDLSYNYVSYITMLIGLTELNSLDLSGNDIGDVVPLCANPGLSDCDYVNLTGNPVTLADASCLGEKGVDVYLDCGSIYEANCTESIQPVVDPDIDFKTVTIGCYSATEKSCITNSDTMPLYVVSVDLLLGEQYFLLVTPFDLPKKLESGETFCANVKFMPPYESQIDGVLEWQTKHSPCSINTDISSSQVALSGNGTWDTENTDYFTQSASYANTFPLSSTGDAAPGSMKVWVDQGQGYKECTTGWAYDVNNNSIVFYDLTGVCDISASGTKIKVWYKLVCFNS